MFIRSQNKLELVPLNKHIVIRIDEDLSLFQIGYWDMWQGEDYFNILGNYSTKEKALKVLDMIDEFHYQYINTQNPTYNEITLTVFQMPQEDEI